MFELTALNSVALAGFGAVVGLLGSVLGIGGGIFVVPLLVLAFGIPIHQAVGVSLAAIVAASSAVASVNVERGLANMRLGVALELPTALGSIAGAVLAGVLAPGLLQFLFSLVLFPVAALMFLKGRRPAGGLPAGTKAPEAGGGAMDAAFFDPSLNAHTSYRVRNFGPAMFISFFAGILSGLLGLGGGVVQVPVMNLLCGVPIKAAAATSNFVIGVSAAASALIYFRKGWLAPDLAAVIVAGVLVGSFVGVRILYKARSERIQTAFAALVLLVALRMLARSL
jgi:hypothetical protein